MEEKLIYIYCVTSKEPNFKDLDCGVYSICHNGLYAIVNKVSKSSFSEENLKKNLSDIKWVEEKAREHIKVINQVMESATVIPFKFGTVFKTEDNLKKMIEDCSGQIKDNISKLDGKEEWSVKIYCDFKILNEKISQISEKIKELDQEIVSSSLGKAFLLKKKREDLIKEEVNKKINECGQNCYEKLKERAEEVVINKLLPKEVTEKENEMILNSAYLVLKEKVETFLDLIEEMKNKHSEVGFEFDCAGPWPPFNFVKMKEKA